MIERTRESALKHLIFISPIPPVLCLAVFALFILIQFVRIPLIAALGVTPLLVSNLFFLLLVALRLAWYAWRLPREQRYDADRRPRGDGVPIKRPVDQVRTDLTGKGYRFAQGGRYGEKRNLAPLGMTVLYGGLFVGLLIGNYDYLYQFSGSVFNGGGMTMALSDNTGYYSVARGPLSSTAALPRMKIDRQILPNKEWPKGATEITLLAKNGAVLARGTVERGGQPLRYNGYEYHFARFLFDAILNITTTNKGYIEVDNFIKLQPMNNPAGNYTYSSRFMGARYRWTALFNPERQAMMLDAIDKNGAQVVNGEIVFQKENKKKMGVFVVDFLGLAQWSEMHVVRTRHMVLLVSGLLIAVVGALLRLAVSPQRVWLDETPNGSRAWAEGGETKKLVKSEETLPSA
jgi:hypothetical protein